MMVVPRRLSFFFQAEDGIRDLTVTGVQTCALPILDQTISRLLAHDRVRAARSHLERTDEVTLARQAALCAIPAPTGAEGRRAAHVAELFRAVGLHDVTIDEVGNVYGWTGSNGGMADTPRVP